MKAPGLFVVIFLCSVTHLIAQEGELDSITRTYQAWRNTSFAEKVFLHTDRSAYLTGETIWLKAYRVDATSHRTISWSRILYLELLDKNKLPVLQAKILLDERGGDGSLFLPASLTSGNYVLRAYTNWMKNSGPEFFFHQVITVLNPFTPLEISADTSQLPYDVQFFPEGGDLVYDIESVVGVRVVDKNGYGIKFKGAILNQHKDTIQHFRSSKFGLGKFKFLPESNQSYTAVVIDNNNKVFPCSIPKPALQGYVMHVGDTTLDRLVITVTGRNIDSEKIYLLAHTRQKLVVQQQAPLRNGIAKFLLDKKELGAGVSSFTIFDKHFTPVCERLYFIKPETELTINLAGNPYLIQPRAKVKLDIGLSSTKGIPFSSTVSIAVVRIDSMDMPVQNIVNYLWLTSDLSGTIENPGYYFGEATPELQCDIDNLVLTHGWRRFDWKNIFEGTVDYAYPPEVDGHLILGRITETATGKPADQIMAYLSFMGTPVNVYVSESYKGRLIFETEPIIGNKSMIVQTNQAVGEQYRIEMDDPYFDKVSFSCPPFSINKKQRKALEQRSIHMQVQSLFYEQKNTDTGKVSSETFYGKPDETYQLDDYTRFPTLEEVMREYVPGVLVRKRKDDFHLYNINLVSKSIFSNEPLVLVDGIPVFDTNKLMEIDPLKLKQLDVIKRRYYLNAMAFDGVVSYTSYKGDLAGFRPPEHVLLLNYKGLETKRTFFIPQYDIKTDSTMPDARRVLYWSVNNLPNSVNHAEAEFFTSDIEGEYRIVIQALTSLGLPAFYTTSFWIKQQ